MERTPSEPPRTRRRHVGLTLPRRVKEGMLEAAVMDWSDDLVPAIPRDLGVDPGRSGQIDCGGNDIPFYEDAIGAMQDRDVRLLYVNNSWNDAYVEAWNFWASLTGGASVRIAPGGTEEGGLPLVIANLVAAIES